jgi:class 3 adenylate cyclase
MATLDFTASILIADDSTDIRQLLAFLLRGLGHTITEAHDGRHALELIKQQPFDLILLDVMMPRLSGIEVLAQIKNDPALRYIPVIVISAAGELGNTVKCIELGAEDFLPKPFDQLILFARINASLERKRLRDNEQAYLRALEQERATSERLLLNVLPQAIADRLRTDRQLIVDRFPVVTVLFADIVDFTTLSLNVTPIELIEWLNDIFSTFDEMARLYGLEKIKTIGDAYMAAAGLFPPRADHAEAAAQMALDMQAMVATLSNPSGEPLHIRIGLDTGPVVAGVIGSSKFSYDLWGDTVNTASRMEALGLSDRIQVTGATYEQLCQRFRFEERGLIAVKGKGEMRTYWLIEKFPGAS